LTATPSETDLAHEIGAKRPNQHVWIRRDQIKIVCNRTALNVQGNLFENGSLPLGLNRIKLGG
jgi:hypothetical protein